VLTLTHHLDISRLQTGSTTVCADKIGNMLKGENVLENPKSSLLG
jgi:hypothetical protein